MQAMGRWPLRHQSSEDLWHLMGMSFCNAGRFFGVFGGGALAGEAGTELGQGPTPLMNRLGRPLEPPAGTVAADECFVRIWCLGSRTVRAGSHGLRCPSVAIARWTAKILIIREMITQNKVGAAAFCFAKFGKYHHLSPA